MTRLRALIVDDEATVRLATGIALRQEGYEVRCEADGSRLATVLQEFPPDLAIIDVGLPTGPDGYAITRRLRQQVDCAIVLITSADTVEDRLRGFTAGADDHLGKPFSLAELLARADALMRRTGRWVQQVYKFGDLLLDDTSRTVLRGDGDIVLTRTEYDLLRVFCRHPGRVLTKRQLLVHVWGPDTVEENVVEVHLSALRRKLESSGPRLLHTVRGVGFVLRA